MTLLSTRVPFTVTRWSRVTPGVYRWGGRITTYTTAEAAPRFNGVGGWTMTVPVNRQSAKIEPTDVFTFDYYNLRMTGVIETRELGTGEKGEPVWTLAGLDALTLLGDYLCYPVPTASLTNQTVARYRATGDAEQTLAALVRANVVTRRGEVLDIRAIGNRGGTITLNERFSNLLTVVLEKIEPTGLGVRMGLANTTSVDARMTLAFYQPRDMSVGVHLTGGGGSGSPGGKGGNLRSWKHTDAVPGGTAAVIGGSGKGTARVFRARIDADAEDRWGRRREFFVDARDETETDVLLQRGTEALAEVASQQAFELDVISTGRTRFAEHYGLGDRVSIHLGAGVSTTDVIRQATMKVEGGGGMTVSLVPGNPDVEPMFKRAAMLRTVRGWVKALQREEV